MDDVSSRDAVNFDVYCLGPEHWRVFIDGELSHVAYECRHSASAAARVQAKQLHLSTLQPTQVRIADHYGTLIREARYINGLQRANQDLQRTRALRAGGAAMDYSTSLLMNRMQLMRGSA